MGFLDFLDKKIDEFGESVDRLSEKVDKYSDDLDKLTEEYKSLSTDELLEIRDQSGHSLDILQKRAAAAQALKARGIGGDDDDD
ncbi:MAG: hypothetical protein SPL39_01975 [Selenomonadaceae bacterium]|nr:hypothetical protein [Selenomonadaceae bacterium]